MGGYRGADALKDDFRNAMRLSANSIAVVTTLQGQTPVGMTVTSWCSLSIDPPSLLVCLSDSSQTAAAILESGFFCVNLLSDSQHHLADVFAGRLDEDRFGSVAWRQLQSGAPVFDGALASFDCTLTGALRPGSHHICLGELRTVRRGAGLPLLYCDRGYGRIVMDGSEPDAWVINR